jgi:ribose/xylose/arabinose/galactoside ABC-type transport system permease subunit
MIDRNLPALVTLIIFVVAYAICAAQFPAMLSFRVIGNLLTDNAFLGILAVGMTVVVVSGGIDLSVGAVIAVTGVLIALAVGHAGMHPLTVFAMVLAIAALFGAGVGAAIYYLQAPPFIVTLMAMFLARGTCFLLTNDSIPVRHNFYATLENISVALPGGGKLRFIAMLMLLTVAIGAVLLHYTKFGANVFALGGNKQSAELMGVPIPRTTILVYCFSSVMAALAGIVFSIYTQAGYSLAAVGVELDAIAAVVIGGTLLSGGAGNMLGSLVGVLIQGLILTYITFDGTLSSWWTKIAIGFLLFVFVALQKLLVHLPELRSNRSLA